VACIVDAIPRFSLAYLHDIIPSQPAIHQQPQQRIPKRYFGTARSSYPTLRSFAAPSDEYEGLDRCPMMWLSPIGTLNVAIDATPLSALLYTPEERVEDALHPCGWES
jgi:hypothetical protein